MINTFITIVMISFPLWWISFVCFLLLLLLFGHLANISFALENNVEWDERLKSHSRTKKKLMKTTNTQINWPVIFIMIQIKKSYYISDDLAANFIAFYNLFFLYKLKFIDVPNVQRWSTTHKDKIIWKFNCSSFICEFSKVWVNTFFFSSPDSMESGIIFSPIEAFDVIFKFSCNNSNRIHHEMHLKSWYFNRAHIS